MDERLAHAETVVFDIGNVLLRYDPESMARTLFPDAIRETLLRGVFFSPVWHLLDAGLRTPAEAAREMAQDCNLPDSEALIERTIREFPLLETQLPMAGRISALKRAGKRVYALSNYPVEAFALTVQRFPFFAEMDGYVISGHIHACKPGKDIYNALFWKYGIAPETAVFFDDMEANVLAARALGMRAYVYDGNKMPALSV